MNKDLFKFSEYLKVERNYSEYTIKNYVLDIEDFILWCKDNKIDKYKVTYKEIKPYLSKLYDTNYKGTTISRKIRMSPMSVQTVSRVSILPLIILQHWVIRRLRY